MPHYQYLVSPYANYGDDVLTNGTTFLATSIKDVEKKCMKILEARYEKPRISMDISRNIIRGYGKTKKYEAVTIIWNLIDFKKIPSAPQSIIIHEMKPPSILIYVSPISESWSLEMREPWKKILTHRPPVINVNMTTGVIQEVAQGILEKLLEIEKVFEKHGDRVYFYIQGDPTLTFFLQAELSVRHMHFAFPIMYKTKNKKGEINLVFVDWRLTI